MTTTWEEQDYDYQGGAATMPGLLNHTPMPCLNLGQALLQNYLAGFL